ncbi:MAG: hypothetical protein Q9213_002877 [Squamulea squamosa]
MLRTLAYDQAAPDPNAYTSGRWLRRDKEEREARHINLNFESLQKRVLELGDGAKYIQSYEKKEGGFNKAFIFSFDNDKKLVARLPTRVAGPSKLTTNSEVATIEYLRSHTSVPIPKILDWSDDPSNAIGGEYIIMEYARGVQLHQKWPTMNVVQRIKCIKSIMSNMKQVAAIVFPAYGSLYFNEADCGFKQPFSRRYCVGPQCSTRYWDCNVGEKRFYTSVSPNQGPWSDVTAYCDGLIDTGLSRLPPSEQTRSDRFLFAEPAEVHARLLSYGRDVLRILATDPRIIAAAKPTLYHSDLHKRNIFVFEEDPTNVTDIIDWQSSSIQPAFEYADEIPDFILPSANAKASSQSVDAGAELCQAAYDACLKGFIVPLAISRALDQDLLRPFRYCHRTWKDGIVAFRQDLIELATRWEALELPPPCPYPLPSPSDLALHEQQFAQYKKAQGVLHQVMDFLDTPSDGWVPSTEWTTTNALHEQFFAECLRAVRTNDEGDNDMDEETLRKMWPFDIPEGGQCLN